MRRVLLPAAFVLLSGVLSCSDMPTAPKLSATPGSVTVEGTITDRDGPAVANSFLAFRLLPDSPTQPSPSHYAYTDVNGAFRIALVQGTYEVRIGAGYETGLPSVTIPKFEVLSAG